MRVAGHVDRGTGAARAWLTASMGQLPLRLKWQFRPTAFSGAEGHATTSEGAYTMSSFSSTAELLELLDATSAPFCGAIHQPGALPAAVFCTGFPLQVTDAGRSVWP